VNTRAGAAACLIAAAAGLAACSTGPTRADPAPETTVSAPARTVESPGDDDAGTDEPTVAPRQATDTIDAYVRAWARPHLSHEAWLTSVLLYTTPEYGRILATVDPANVPATTITGPVTVRTSTTAAVTADVPTDAGLLRVTVVARDSIWLVTATELQRGAR
jgi:hypothetical protein